MAAAFDAEAAPPGSPQRVLKSPRGHVESVGGSPYLGDVVKENGGATAIVAVTTAAGSPDVSGDSLAAYLPPALAPPLPTFAPLAAAAEESLEAYLPPPPPVRAPAPATVDESLDDELFFPNPNTRSVAAGSGGAAHKAGARVTPRSTKDGTPSSRLAGGAAAKGPRKTMTAAKGAKKTQPAPPPPSRRQPLGGATSARARGAMLAKKAAAKKAAAAGAAPPPPPPRSTRTASAPRAARATATSSRAGAAPKAKKPALSVTKRRVAPAPPPPRAARSTAASSGKVGIHRSAASAASARMRPVGSAAPATKKKPPVSRKAVSTPRGGSGGAPSKPSFMSPTQSTAAHTRRAGAAASTKGRGAKVDVDDAVSKAKARLRQKQLRERQSAAAERLSRKSKPPPPPPRRVTPRSLTARAPPRRAGAPITASQQNARKGATIRSKGRGPSVTKNDDLMKEAKVAQDENGAGAGAGAATDGEVNPAEDSTAVSAADDGKENVVAAADVDSAALNLTIDTAFDDANKESGPVSGTSSAGSALETAQEKIDTHRIRMESARAARRPPKQRTSKEETMKAALYKPFRPSKASPTKLTVPRPPRLSTSARLGDKYVPPVEEKPYEFGENFTTELTRPRPFHLSFQARTPTAARPPSTPTLAESLEEYARHGLRESTPEKKSEPFVPTLTVPKPFHLSESPMQGLPKSRVQLEEEMMAEFEAKPFKAQPVSSSGGGGAGGVPKIPKRELTTQVPFRLSTEDRGAHAAHPLPPTTEEMRAEECLKQFHARPLPDLSYQPPAATPQKNPGQHLTTPKPFKLRSVQRHEASLSHKPPPTPDEVELAKRFHAIPVPASVYRAPPSMRRDPVERSRTCTTPRAPKLSTTARMTDTTRRDMEERGFHNVEERARERERSAKLKQREDMREAIEKASGYSTPRSKGPTVPRPFNFPSNSRHEAHVAEQEERVLNELEEIKQQAKSFRARPAPSSTRRPRPESSRKRDAPERILTEPAPFRLLSAQRHTVAQQELLVQMEAEEEERRRLAMGVKATPIPRSTYKRPPSTPRAPAELSQPVGPQLMTERQSEHRRHFDEEVRERREAELLQKKRDEEAKVAEIEREIQELRRLPVSEGGLLQVANPINLYGNEGGMGTSFQSGGSIGSIPRSIAVQTTL